jgi:hypothetical protein
LEQNIGIESDQLLHLKEQKKKEDRPRLLDSLHDEEQLLKTDADVSMVSTCWLWKDKNDWLHNLNREEEVFYYLLISTYQGVRELSTSEFNKIVLETFENSLSIAQAIKTISNFIEDDDIQQIQELIKKRIRQLVEGGFLIDPQHHKFNVRHQPLLKTLVTHG